MTIRVPLPERRSWILPILIVLLFAALLIFLATAEPPLVMAPAVGRVQPVSLGTNPEVITAQHWMERQRPYLAVNPELKSVQNAVAFQAQAEEAYLTSEAFLAENPELISFYRYRASKP
jgi:hypothetical protein